MDVSLDFQIPDLVLNDGFGVDGDGRQRKRLRKV